MQAQAYGQAEHHQTGLFSRSQRQSLAKMLMRLFARWELSTAEQASALGLSEANRATLARYRRGEPLGENRDLLERAGHLLAIHESLRSIFLHDDDLAYRWMRTHNQRIGAKPMDIIRERGFEGLLAVRRYLDFERGR